MAGFFAAYKQEATRRKHTLGLSLIAKVTVLPVARRQRVIKRINQWANEYLVDLDAVQVDAEVEYTRLFWQRRFANLTRFLKAQVQFLAR